MTPSKAKEIIDRYGEYLVKEFKNEPSVDKWLATPQAAALLSGEDWISVGERLPEINEPLMGYNDDGIREVIIPNYQATVLAFDPALGVFKAQINKQHHWTEVSSVSSRGGINVTHWMPLPEPPKP